MKKTIVAMGLVLLLSSIGVRAEAQSEFAPKGFTAFGDATLGAFFTGTTSYAGATLGYHFNRAFFLGLGVAGGKTKNPSFEEDERVKFMPLYGCMKVNFIDKRATPFFDLRIGRDLADSYKFYSSMSLGCRMKLGKVALCLSEGLDISSCDYDWGTRNSNTGEIDHDYQDHVMVFAITRFSIEIP